MRVLPELEAYRDRLMARAAAWPESAETALRRDLRQCLEQVRLLEQGVARLGRLHADEGGAAAGDNAHESRPSEQSARPSGRPPAADDRRARGAAAGTTGAGARQSSGAAEEGMLRGEVGKVNTVGEVGEVGEEAGDAGDARLADEHAGLAHRLAIQDQMRELTAAYAEALRRRLES